MKPILFTLLFYGGSKLLLLLFSIKHTITVDFLIIISAIIIHFILGTLLGFLASPKFLLKYYIPSQLEEIYGIDRHTIPDKCLKKMIIESYVDAEEILKHIHPYLTKPERITIAADKHIRSFGGTLTALKNNHDKESRSMLENALRDLYDLHETEIQFICFKK